MGSEPSYCDACGRNAMSDALRDCEECGDSCCVECVTCNSHGDTVCIACDGTEATPDAQP